MEDYLIELVFANVLIVGFSLYEYFKIFNLELEIRELKAKQNLLDSDIKFLKFRK